MQKLLKVAVIDKSGKVRWTKWEDTPSVLHYKKLYKTNPEKFMQKSNTLYLRRLDNYACSKIVDLFDSCLSIAGSKYALALALGDGDRQSQAFMDIHKTLEDAAFKDTFKWMKIFEDYIKKYAHTVGMMDDAHVKWLDVSETLGIKTNTLQGYYSAKPELFEEINNVVYFLDTQNILLESMFFRAVELAGNEYKLATAIANDRLEIERHYKNFERMTFKHPENFKCYSKLIARYLKNNNSLFEEEVFYA